MSEKTLERVENGTAVRNATYKRIAEAFGLDGAAFTTAAYIPTIEELTGEQNANRSNYRRRTIVLLLSG